jgi:PA14 domain
VFVSDQARRVQLDCGACAFNAEGNFLSYRHTSAEEVLSPQEYARDHAVGFATLVDLPRQGDPALVRFVVRDRETGNLGTIDVPTAVAGAMELTKSQVKDAKNWAAKQKPESPGSFGSIVPKSDALCGDVYELTPGTRALPNFGNMEAIGAIYTYSLNVPYQFDEKGLPGVTSRPEWFGIDYYGEFWARVPGAYHFKMSSDDGAVLYIDDNSVIDLDRVHTITGDAGTIKLNEGRHTVRIRYFQETMHVALIVKVKAPGGDFRVFDLRDFSRRGEGQ